MTIKFFVLDTEKQCFRVLVGMVLYLAYVSLNGLKNSDRDMVILMMIQGVGHCQLLIIQQSCGNP